MDRIVANAMNDAKEPSGGPPPEGMRKITLYRNGFTIDDGPFRDLESPENKQFIASLSDGYIPREVSAPLFSPSLDQPFSFKEEIKKFTLV
jgi:hypothetical protein